MSNFIKTGKVRHESRHRAAKPEPQVLLEVPDYGNSPWDQPADGAEHVRVKPIVLDVPPDRSEAYQSDSPAVSTVKTSDLVEPPVAKPAVVEPPAVKVPIVEAALVEAPAAEQPVDVERPKAPQVGRAAPVPASPGRVKPDLLPQSKEMVESSARLAELMEALAARSAPAVPAPAAVPAPPAASAPPVTSAPPVAVPRPVPPPLPLPPTPPVALPRPVPPRESAPPPAPAAAAAKPSTAPASPQRSVLPPPAQAAADAKPSTPAAPQRSLLPPLVSREPLVRPEPAAPTPPPVVERTLTSRRIRPTPPSTPAFGWTPIARPKSDVARQPSQPASPLDPNQPARTTPLLRSSAAPPTLGTPTSPTAGPAAPAPTAPPVMPARPLASALPTPTAKKMKLASPGEAFHQASGPADDSELGNLLALAAGPEIPVPASISAWRPPQYEQAEQPDRYNPAPLLTGVPWKHKRSHGGLWVAAILVILLAAGGFIGYRALKSNSVTATVPAGSGVLASDPTEPAGTSGTVYRSTVGHFALRTPDQASLEMDRSRGSDVGISYTIEVATDPAQQGVIAGGNLTPAVAAANASTYLRASILDGNDDATDIQLRNTTFHGRIAVVGSLKGADGTTIRVLAVLWGSQREYLFASPTAAGLTAMEKAFAALP